MDDPSSSFARFAGLARFPRDDTDLRSTTRCPACFTPLAAVVCGNCGLDLGNENAARLALVSTDAAGLLDERIELIGRIRFETELARREAAPAGPPAPAAVERAAVATAPSAMRPGQPPRSPAAAPVAPAGPRRSSVQVALVVVGISLLSIAAVFFLVYAFINYGIVWRSVIIGAITAAAFVVASVLRRRGLSSTAEGIGAFAVVLVYLDAFAVRANDLFGASAADPLVYWGAALVLSAVVFGLWFRAARLRVASVAAAAVFAPGVGLLVAGALDSLDDPQRVYWAFMAVAVAGLVHPWVGERGAARDRLTLVERAIAVGIGLLGLVGALVVGSELARVGEPALSAALWAVAALAAAHVALLLRTTDRSLVARVVAAVHAAIGGLAASLALVLLAFRLLDASGAMAGITVAPTVLVLALAAAARRTTTPALRSVVRTAAVAAGVVTATMLLLPLGYLVAFAVNAVVSATSARPRSMAFDAALRVPDATVVWSAGALALVLLAVVAFLRATGTTGGSRVRTAWAGATLVVLSVPLLAAIGAIVALWLATSAVALVLVARWPRAGMPAWLRAPLLAVAAIGTTLAYAVSWAGTETWLLGTLGAVVLLVAARAVVSSALTAGVAIAVRAAFLGTATLVAMVGAGAVGAQWRTGSGVDIAGAVVGLAVVLVIAGALPLPRALTPVDRRVVVLLASAALVVSLPVADPALPLATALLAGVLGWILPAHDDTTLLERRIAALALAPVIALVVHSAAVQADLASDTGELAAIAGALVASALSLALLTSPRRSRLRPAADAGIALVAVIATVPALVSTSPVTWIVLLLAAVTTLACAVSSDGLFAAAGGRRLLGWLALALATAAFWWRLAETGVSAVEPYTLPLAGAILAVAALDRRARRRSRATPALVLAALIVGLVPSALATIGDTPARAVLVAAIAAALLLVGSVARTDAALRPYLDAAAFVGFTAFVTVVVGRVSDAEPADATADVWLAASLAILVLAAVGQSSGRPGDRAVTANWGRAIALTALTLVTVVESTVLDSSTAGFARAVVAVTLLCAAHVVGQVGGRPPFDRVTALIALAYAAVVAVAAQLTDAVPAVEWVSAPIALTLLAVASLRLARDPALRSSPTLGPALLVLFVPSLVEGSDDGQAWRLVAVGVLAVAAIVVGLVRKLQAPFIAGVVVALVHASTTFAPQIAAIYAATEWWVWIGIGGAVITLLAARYERSLRTAKNVVASIRTLR